MHIKNQSERLPRVPHCTRLAFTARDTLSLAGLNGIVHVVNLKTKRGDHEPFPVTRLCHDSVEVAKANSVPVLIATSEDGTYLAVADSLNRLDVYDIPGRRWWCKVPTSTDALASCLSLTTLHGDHGDHGDAQRRRCVLLMPVTQRRASRPTQTQTRIRVFSVTDRQFLTRDKDGLEAHLDCLPWLRTRKDKILGVQVVREMVPTAAKPFTKPGHKMSSTKMEASAMDMEVEETSASAETATTATTTATTMHTDILYMWTNHWVARVHLGQLALAVKKCKRWFPTTLSMADVAAAEELGLDDGYGNGNRDGNRNDNGNGNGNGNRDVVSSVIPKSQRGLYCAAQQLLQQSIAVTHRFQNILHFDFLTVHGGGGEQPSLEACVVERPWSSILQEMPAPLQEKTFGI